MYQLLTVTGPDAESFLQAQLTQDIRACDPVVALPAAWCNAKGRVIATMRILRRTDGFVLVIGGGLGELVLARISIFRFRAKVDLALATEWRSLCCDNDDPSPWVSAELPDRIRHASQQEADRFAIRIGSGSPTIELFGHAQNLRPGEHGLDHAAWSSELIRMGHVIVDASTTEKFTPHMLSLDLAGALSFVKGCYPGQEIVARTEHLGKSNRRLVRYELHSDIAGAGSEVSVNGKGIGSVVSASGRAALAVIATDHLHTTAEVAGIAARPAPLPWQVEAETT